MSSHHHHHQQHHPAQGGGAPPAHLPYWKRAHSDWRFWFGVILMLGAMVVYLMSFDLALAPRPQVPAPVSGIGGQ